MIASPSVREALDALDRGHLPIPLQPHTKIPPRGFDLSRYIEHPPDEVTTRRLFRGDCNIAVALGEASGGLAVRDFDDQEAYERWKASFPALARVLPTVETHRGRHVYFTATAHEVASYARCRDSSIIVMGDGELRRGGYVVMPSSRHPLGSRYRWESPPDNFPFVADVLEAGLVSEKPLRSQEWDTRDSFPAGLAWEGVTVAQAIEITQPTGTGQRHHRIFSLVRFLRSIPEARDAEPTTLKPIVRRWHRKALPRIRTKAFDITWLDFLDGWNRVRVPVGMTIRAVASEASGDGIDRLADLCRLLQLRAGDRPFFLDCRTAGQVLGVGRSTANRWLRRLHSEGVIRIEKAGTRVSRRATEFSYIGDATPKRQCATIATVRTTDHARVERQ